MPVVTVTKLVTVTKYECDICNREYDPSKTEPGEYAGPIVQGLHIAEYYAPTQHLTCICKLCSDHLIKTLNELHPVGRF